MEDVGGEAVVNSSSSTNNTAGSEAGLSSEEARTRTGGVGKGREEDNGDGLHKYVGEDGEESISFEGQMMNQQNQIVLEEIEPRTRSGVWCIYAAWYLKKNQNKAIVRVAQIAHWASTGNTLHTISGCGKREAHINWPMVTCQGSTRY
ncbi:unnamed protein product [Ascophyllum nodosum]